jgi:hypothetical protein
VLHPPPPPFCHCPSYRAPNNASSMKMMGRSCSLCIPRLLVVGRCAIKPLPWQRQIAQGTMPPPPGRGSARHLRPLPPYGWDPTTEVAQILPPCRKTTKVATQRPIKIGTWHMAMSLQRERRGRATSSALLLVHLDQGGCGGGCGCSCGAEDEVRQWVAATAAAN